GTWSRVINNSKRSWAWTTSRDARGLASITTPPCASWRIASWPWSDCVVRPPRWMTWWTRRPLALSEDRPGSGGTAASLHAAGGSPRFAMLAGLPMPIRLPGLQSQVHLHIGIYITPNEVVLRVRPKSDIPQRRRGRTPFKRQARGAVRPCQDPVRPTL